MSGKLYSMVPMLVALLSVLTTNTSIPIFDDSKLDVMVVSGETATLPCRIHHKERHKVIWMSPRRILISQEKEIVIDDPRISIERPFEGDWNLQIQHVRQNDSGAYTCQINTSPVRIKRVYLFVQVPSHILNAYSSSDVEVDEGDDVALTCRTTGDPQPNVTWFRRSLHNKEGKDQLNVYGEVLELPNIQRYESGMYICLAYNGVPPAVTRQMEVRVQYSPVVTLLNSRLGQIIGKETVLECTVTAYPKPSITWKKDRLPIRNDFRHRLEQYSKDHEKVSLSLSVMFIEKSDFGRYTCDASNRMGTNSMSMELYEYIPPTPVPPKTTTTRRTTTDYIIRRTYRPPHNGDFNILSDSDTQILTNRDLAGQDLEQNYASAGSNREPGAYNSKDVGSSCTSSKALSILTITTAVLNIMRTNSLYIVL